LIGGDWYIENVLQFLDQPGEYFFDRDTNHLYVRPNSTDDLTDFTLGLMTELIDLRDATDVVMANIGFRDMAATYMEDGWSAPSGGDWALHRGGAIFIENSSNITIRGCHFFRLDGNAIFLSRKTRFVTIEDSMFEWLGENAIATWGDTDDYDGTSENFPMFTTIQYNVFRELGVFQKQSSAVGVCKAALTTIRHNVIFNIGRAAINFNDNLGGGDIVFNNLLFNTCRESGTSF
jgi:Right handed beta helix region